MSKFQRKTKYENSDCDYLYDLIKEFVDQINLNRCCYSIKIEIDKIRFDRVLHFCIDFENDNDSDYDYYCVKTLSDSTNSNFTKTKIKQLFNKQKRLIKETIKLKDICTCKLV